MSPDAEERLPSRGPKPGTKRPAAVKPSEEPNAWQPNPGKVKGKGPAAMSTRAKPAIVAEPEAVDGGPGWWERVFFGGVGAGQLALYTRQFASYLDAGVDLLKTLTSLERQFARTALGPVTARLLVAVRRGDALGEAMAREPRAFDKLCLSMIKVAEARGGVPETLRMLSRHYEGRQTLIRQARAAMIYPIVVLTVAAGVVTLLTVWLLPTFLELLRDIAGRGAELPLPSRALMAFSRFIQALGWWLVPLVLIAGPMVVFRIYRTGVGKRVMDAVALRVPVLGKLLGALDTTRFARSLASLLGAGVDVGESLDLTAEVMLLDPFRRAILRAKEDVMHGSEISVALNSSRRFGADVIAILGSGEETGKLPESLEHLANDYEEQVTYMVKNLGQLVQPLLMVMLGGIVIFIILAVVLPYIAILNSLSR